MSARTSSTGTSIPSLNNGPQDGAVPISAGWMPAGGLPPFSSPHGGVPIDGLVKAVNLIPSGQRATGGKTPTAAGPAASAPGDSPVGAYVILAALVFAIAASAMFVMTK